ncbi:pilus assembly protein PilM [Pseudomonas eucalypticola]|uniref:Pilus assembly protein PilM n=1 Tax=Pseudomonas eucalypticola TaxID=2599595 RepID=A0A7D5HXH8_9PSED|nr:pilus assembly protein PilM [Pseudomonas eucalypticola]
MKIRLPNVLERLRHGLYPLVRQWQASRARRWLLAWLQELHGLLPTPLRARLASGPAVQRLAWPLPTRLDATCPAVLELPALEVMAQTITLPAAATADLTRVLAFELDRYTPYAADQVHFTARVLRRNGDQARVLLVAVSRERLAAILEQCQAAGLTLRGIDAKAGNGEPLGIDLLPAHLRPAPSRTARLNRGLAVGAVVLLAALMLATLGQRQAQVDRMAQAVAQQRQQVQALEAVRHELTDTQGAARYLARLKTARPTATALLTELSACLGDDTWLEQLEVRDNGDVSLSGQSRHASALISRARDCHSLQGAHFQGVIQPDSHTGNDRFALAAHLSQEAADAPTPDPQ